MCRGAAKDESLIDFWEGRADPAEVEQIQERLTSCPACQGRLAWLGRTVPLLQVSKEPVANAPAAAVARACALYRERFPTPSDPESVLDRSPEVS